MSGSASAVQALPGPDWLRDLRVAAAARADATELPTADDEEWRYTPIGDLDLSAYRVADRPGEQRPDEPVFGDPTVVVRVVDGHVVDVDQSRRPAGLEVIDLAVDGEVGMLDPFEPESPDVVGLLNSAYGPGPLLVRTKPGAVVGGTVLVINDHVTDGVVSAPRLVVDLADDSECSVIEVHRGPADALIVPVTDIRVGPAARSHYAAIQELGPTAWQLALQRYVVAGQSNLHAATVALGGSYARVRTDCRLAGRGASAVLLGAAFADDHQTLDFRTFQDHAAPDTTSELLYKGVTDDHARTITTGLIRVEPEAAGTNAFQTNRNVKLSEHAWAESVPNLEIENNEVRCSHASTVGPVDEDQAFYLHSRGVPPGAAERLIVTGFLDEVFDRLGHDDLAAELRRRVQLRLEVGGHR